MNRRYTVTKRLPDICTGHRLPNHPGGCKFLHGHNFQIYITASAYELTKDGFVIDFAELKKFTQVTDLFDHAFVLWELDPFAKLFRSEVVKAGILDANPELYETLRILGDRVFTVPWIPTVENISSYFLAKAKEMFDNGRVSIDSIRMFETENSECTVTN